MFDLPCGVFNRNYEEDMAIVRTRLQWAWLIGFLILLFSFPLFLPGEYLYLLIYMGVGVIAALGLNILTGYCGQISIGQSAFMGVGAFSAGLLMTKTGLPFWFALPIGGIMAGLVGLLFGIPSLRVKGLYLALATLAAQFIIYFFIVHFFEGDKGVHIPPPAIGGLVFSTDESFYYIVMALTVLFTFFAKSIVRTRAGRAFIAIRDNDIAAEVMGINIFRYKLLAFFVGCFFAGIAGALWATYMGLASAEHYTLLDSIWLLGMIVVGGLGTVSGTIFGVVFIRGFEYLVQLITPVLSGAIPALSGNMLAAFEVLSFGLIILLFLIFEPRGLNHRWEIIKTSCRLHPWAH